MVLLLMTANVVVFKMEISLSASVQCNKLAYFKDGYPGSLKCINLSAFQIYIKI